MASKQSSNMKESVRWGVRVSWSAPPGPILLTILCLTTYTLLPGLLMTHGFNSIRDIVRKKCK